MRKILLTVLTLASLFIFSGRSCAQDFVTNGLTAQAAACPTNPGNSSSSTSAITLATVNAGGATFTIGSTTFSGTVTFYGSGDGGTTWQTLSVTPSNSTTLTTTATAAGVWQTNVSGYTHVCMVVTTFSSGTVTATIRKATASARAGSGGGGSAFGTPPASPSGVYVGCETANGVVAGMLGWCGGIAFLNGTQFAVPYVSGAPSTLSGVTAPTTPDSVPFYLCSIPSGGAAQIPSWCWPGVGVNAQTGTTYPTFAPSDRGSIITFNNAGAVAVTPPALGSTNFSNNFNFGSCNIGAGLVTFTPTTSLWNGSASGTMPTHWCSYAYSDPANNYRVGTFADIAAYTNCPNGALGFVASTGAFPCSVATLDSILNPLASKTFTWSGTNSLNMTWGNATSAGDLVTIQDGASNSGNGNLLTLSVGSGSNTSGLKITNNGNSAGGVLLRLLGGSSTAASCNNFVNCVFRSDIVQGGAVLGSFTVGASSTSDGIVVSPIAAATGKCLRSNNPGSTTTINWAVDCATGLNTSDGGFISTPALHAITMPVTIGSGTSISSTTLCAAADCPAGTYEIPTYIDITTACGTSGTYIVNLIYTDDQGAKTVVVNINGTGSVPATGTLTTTSTANFGQNAQVIRVASGNINYSTTATACGSAGPMVGKLYMVANRVM